MDCEPQAPLPEEDEVTYYVNKDSVGWVEQHVRRRLYIKLKLECIHNRSRNVHKARDDWLCLYCRGSFPSKLQLTNHRVGGCPCGPLDSSGSKWELHVYPISRQQNKVRTWNLLCSVVMVPYETTSTTIRYGWILTLSLETSLTLPPEPKCRSAGSWSPHSTHWWPAQPQQQRSGRKGNPECNSLPSNVLPARATKFCWPWRWRRWWAWSAPYSTQETYSCPDGGWPSRFPFKPTIQKFAHETKSFAFTTNYWWWSANTQHNT